MYLQRIWLCFLCIWRNGESFFYWFPFTRIFLLLNADKTFYLKSIFQLIYKKIWYLFKRKGKYKRVSRVHRDTWSAKVLFCCPSVTSNPYAADGRCRFPWRPWSAIQSSACDHEAAWVWLGVSKARQCSWALFCVRNPWGELCIHCCWCPPLSWSSSIPGEVPKPSTQLHQRKVSKV